MQIRVHQHTVGAIRHGKNQVPLIRLSGKWLENCGFKPGSKFVVNEMKDMLYLTLDDDDGLTGELSGML